MHKTTQTTQCGYIALIGRPNVGKSTLLNSLIGQKISITSRKPQTTRYRILGIKTLENAQFVYVDTPGLHRTEKRTLNRYMNKSALAAIAEVDIIILMLDGNNPLSLEDEWILTKLKQTQKPLILVLNKVDKLADKDALLPLIASLHEQSGAIAIVPISAKKKKNLAALETVIKQLLPEGPHLFFPEQNTDRSPAFLAAELVREKLFRYLGKEVPYSINVEIEQFRQEENLLRISAVIWVEKAGQKAIVLGKKGTMLKEIGQLARLDMEKLFQQKVFLQLWIKVKEGWANDEHVLQGLGYENFPTSS